jgi:catechol-2,3-dioxygenase
MNDFPVIAIRSVELGVPDAGRAEEFYRDAWGLRVSARQDDAIYLRGTGRDHHVLALRPHATAEILSVSFRVKDVEALDRIARRVVSAHGAVVSEAGPNPEPDGGLVLKVATSEGYIFGFHVNDATYEDEETRPALPFRLSHVNLNCRNVDATSRFFQEALGFSQSDRSRAMAFLRCNSDHHAVVLADAGVDGLNHVAFMMPEWESVMLGSGRMVDHGFPIGWGVGRHGPGNNVFAYFVDPFGFVIEYTAEVLQVGDDYQPHGPDYWVWPPGRTDQWGIAPAKTESVKNRQLAIRFAIPKARAATQG